MYSGDSTTFDDYRKKLQNVLQDPSEEPVRLSLDYLKTITNGFSKERLVGKGGFGEVYRGVLGRDKFVAVKKLEHVVDDGKYQAELKSLMRIRHPNIVQLIGYCAETKVEAVPLNGDHILAEVRQRLLCFEYISKGSLRDYVQVRMHRALNGRGTIPPPFGSSDELEVVAARKRAESLDLLLPDHVTA